MSLLAKNKKAYLDYEILNIKEAGIILHGYEVKSVKEKQINLKGSFIHIQDSEVYLKNANISRYPKATIPHINPIRNRKLLLNRKEIDYLEGKMKEKGITIVPLEVFLKNNLVKVKIGVVRGKKLFDKRQTMKERSVKREIEQRIKKYVN